jgi:zinc resistance-associated protein
MEVIMKKSIIVISSVVFLALFTGSVFAFGPGMGMGGGYSSCRGFGGGDVWDDLSKEQKDELTALRQKFIDETYALRTSMFQKHQEMRLLMETSAPDRAKLSKLSGEILDIEKQLNEKQIDFMLAAKKISPELALGAGFGRGQGKSGKRGGNWDCPRNQDDGRPYNN